MQSICLCHGKNLQILCQNEKGPPTSAFPPKSFAWILKIWDLLVRKGLKVFYIRHTHICMYLLIEYVFWVGFISFVPLSVVTCNIHSKYWNIYIISLSIIRLINGTSWVCKSAYTMSPLALSLYMNQQQLDWSDYTQKNCSFSLIWVYDFIYWNKYHNPPMHKNCVYFK